MRKHSTVAQIALALGLGAGFALALPWYYDVFVDWKPALYPFAIIAVTVGIAALTLLTLWARGERKALHYIWKALLSTAAFLGSLVGVTYYVNNVLGSGNKAKQAATLALPLCVVQIFVLLILFLLGSGRKGGKVAKAITIGLSAVLAAGALYAGAQAWPVAADLAYEVRMASVKVGDAETAMKTRPTIYTPEKRAAMMENAQREQFYAGAQETIAKAELYLDHIDELRGMVVAEGLPRYYAIGPSGDQDRHCCKYCGTDLHEKYGRYSWRTDPFGQPWKIQCPDCERWFPSNDFAGYYKLGLDERGVFRPALAKEKNDALVAAGGDGYLKNILYPEMGEGWGVDDGFGYYIAFYIHDGVWDGTGQARAGSVSQALRDLRDAYLYTGEAKYGRAGAILLDRVADFYPEYDWSLWNGFRGVDANGTILDVVWGNYLASLFCEAYDAFFPVYDDPALAVTLGKSGEEIRLNAENGILRTVYRFAVTGQLRGNFGITQQTVTAAAVALDAMPETGEWLDWVMAYGGGDVAGKLIDVVDRDGMGNEASPSYNSIWVNYLIDMAELLDGYDTYPAADIYKNPKFVQMLYAQLPVIMANYYSAQIGDSGQTASTGFTLGTNLALKAYRATGDPVFAQFLYLAGGNAVEGLSEGMDVKEPFKIQGDVQNVIDQYGELNLGSTLMAGYGLAALRGNQNKSGFWMYFGSTGGHGHPDSLNLGLDAYGLNMAPELGYPVATADDPHDVQWLKSTLSHNTVFVDGEAQIKDFRAVDRGAPLHFDDVGRVKLMDIDDSPAYKQTGEYRRTLVMVEVDDEVSYGVDFFRVVGGNDHIYSFHSQSDEIFGTEGLALVPQEGGTYAGPDVPCAPDPNSYTGYGLRYPAGFTWLDNVRRASNPSGMFSVDFAVKDFHGVLEDNEDLHLRMTQVNDFDLDEVAIARGMPPRLKGNPEYLEYVLARRTGKHLDSLFTTVFEPYKGERYLADIQAVPNGVKVTHANGRVDVIEYRNGERFVSVSIYAPDGQLEYRYTNDEVAYTGKIVSFTKALSLENSIRVKLDQPIDLQTLSGQHIYVDNDGKENGVYRIESANVLDDGCVLLNIGRVSPIRGLKGRTDLDRFVYNIRVGQKFRIPMPLQ